MTPEKKVQNKIIKYLKDLQDLGEPIFYERRQAGGYSYKAGLPDLWFVYNGIHVEVEIKKPGGERKVLQTKMAKSLIDRKVLYILVDNLEPVKQMIEAIKNLFTGGESHDPQK